MHVESCYRQLLISCISNLFLLVLNSHKDWTSSVAQRVKNPPAVQDSRVQSLGRGRSPGEGNGNHSGTLAWRIPWTEEPGGLPSMGSQRVGHD